MNNVFNIRVHTEYQGNYSVREESRNGKEYMVVPVVMMVEGVHAGSGGPILHLQDNFSQNPSEWNGVPLTAGHPVSDGSYVSANSVNPEHWVVGHVENAHVNDGKLKAEAWIQVQRAIAVNPEIVNYLNEGRPLEVSTGARTQELAATGQWNNEEYHAITQSYQPDHLALLPGDKGACSWADGCGIRTNKEEESNEMNTLKEDIKNGIGVHNGLQANATGYVELSRHVQTLLDRRDSEAQMNFLKEVYDDYFVYEVRDRDRGTQKFYRQEYSFNEDQNQLNLEDSPREVRRNVEYVPIQSNQANEEENDEETSSNGGCGCSMKRTKFNTNTNQKEDDTMSDSKNKQPSGDVMEKVVSLVNNERTRFTKADREWLLQMNEAQLDKLTPTEAPKAEVSREDALSVLSEDLSSTEKLLNIVSDDIKEQIQTGITAYEDERNKLIKNIQANTGDIWTKEKLEAMDTDTLQSLEKSSRKTDYSAQGPVTNNSQGSEESEEMLLPSGVKLQS